MGKHADGIERFNSIKVRLKAVEWFRAELDYLFQFHKGAIKRIPKTRCFHQEWTFQFHKGAIKSFIAFSILFIYLVSIP